MIAVSRTVSRAARTVLPFLAAVTCSFPAQAQYRIIAVSNAGSIAGCVRLASSSVAPEKLPRTKDADFCGVTPSAERLAVGPENGIHNAVVFLKDVHEGKGFAGGKPVVLRQHRCDFVPHVATIRADAPLMIVNDDRVLHNVHAYDISTTPATLFNIAQPIKGQSSRIDGAQFRNAAVVMTTCDAGHPWMSAFVFRMEHPYFAVTDERGRFVLDKVPPGTYQVMMWHEGVAVRRRDIEKGKVTKYTFEDPYQQTQEVTVRPQSCSPVDFILTLRDKAN